MKILIIVVSLVCIGIYFLRRSAGRYGLSNYRDAVEYEKDNEYKDACYSYALAASQGVNINESKERMKDLIDTHGPFDFADKLEKLKTELSCQHYSCAEGYHDGPMAMIKEIQEKIIKASI